MPKVLLLEQNETHRDLLAHCLRGEGYVVSAADGREALARIGAGGLDLLLIGVPAEADLSAVLRQVRALPDGLDLPVIVISALHDSQVLVPALEAGADDYLAGPFDPVLLLARVRPWLDRRQLRDQERRARRQAEREKKRADDLLHSVIPLGVALAAERDFNRLLERILLESMGLCNADGGTLYLRTEDDRLQFVMVHNRSLGITLGGTTGNPVTFPPLSLYDPSGAPEDRYVVAHAALTGTSVHIPDAYNAEGFDFSGTRAFDERTGYHSTSFFNVPLKDSRQRVLGVLQLINAQDPETGRVVPFDEGLQQVVESLSLLAAAALEAYEREQRLRRQIEGLRIEIDEARKARQVAEITGTDYFQDLQQKAQSLRRRTGRADS